MAAQSEAAKVGHKRSERTNLVATWAWPEVLVGEIELLDAEGTELLLLIVDELVYLCAGHDVRGDGGRWWRTRSVFCREMDARIASRVAATEQCRGQGTNRRTPAVDGSQKRSLSVGEDG